MRLLFAMGIATVLALTWRPGLRAESGITSACPPPPNQAYVLAKCSAAEGLLTIVFDYSRVDALLATYNSSRREFDVNGQAGQTAGKGVRACFAPAAPGNSNPDLYLKTTIGPAPSQPVLFRRTQRPLVQAGQTKVQPCSQQGATCIIYIEPIPGGSPCP